MRFLRTFEYVTKGVEHPHNDLISIPDNGELITQLSQPTYSYTETGLIKIQSKDEMRAAGGKSPDHADATVYAYIPAGNSSGELVTFGEQRVMS